MRRLSLALICLAACSGPVRKGETQRRVDSFASVSLAPRSVTVEIETAPSLALLAEIDRMAARVDMLKLQQSDPRALTDARDPGLQPRLLSRQLAAFDLRLMEFEEAHPRLDPSSLERYERLVREPFRELQERAGW